MATIEFITKRIEGKEKELAKLQKKMERIRKAEASNWENNPYWYSERDIRITERDIELAQKALKDYQDQLTTETEKANSRNIQVIIDFLNEWKARVRESYTNALPNYLEARYEYYKVDREYCDWFNSKCWWSEDKEERARQLKEKDRERKAAQNKFYKAWNWFTPYLEYNDTINYDKLDKDLQKEADAKYDDIIERTNEITGTITDASSLYIGAKGDLNGYIIGERGKAKVETIGAGGYNIQCYHFRTLIHKMK